jgi:hypothetical protein
MQRFVYWEPKLDKLVSPIPSGSEDRDLIRELALAAQLVDQRGA